MLQLLQTLYFQLHFIITSYNYQQYLKMGCGTNFISKLTSQYGKQKILNYVKSQIGGQFLSDKFSSARSAITSKFNDKIPFDASNIDAYDGMMEEVSNTQNKEISQMMNKRPRIPELDFLKQQNPEGFGSFISTAKQEYGDKIKDFQNSVMENIKDKVNPESYFKGKGFDKYL